MTNLVILVEEDQARIYSQAARFQEIERILPSSDSRSGRKFADELGRYVCQFVVGDEDFTPMPTVLFAPPRLLSPLRERITAASAEPQIRLVPRGLDRFREGVVNPDDQPAPVRVARPPRLDPVAERRWLMKKAG